ncbi:fibronectin type III domain-containing protein [Oceanicola sp. D3]|uniref:fibronectin type III domain-containing protein n=1 Tax=Oceanicola sp. D3 TaxID=2587163 RepID=UPI001120D146|nr:fibronectin type III domain-containing protein [Oceanicola sp. D3]QDC11284.1 fibronectin type III domain-containing protein [Oceanicola sp. D3]
MKCSTRAAVLALTFTTAIVPPKTATAAPVAAFFSGVVAAISGAGFFSGAYLSGAYFLGYSATTAIAGSLVGRVLLSVGLNYLVTALTRPNFEAPRPSARMANYAQPVVYAEWCFGRVRKGGPLGFTGAAKNDDIVTGRSGWKRHYSPILAAHPISGIVQHYLDERLVEVDADGTVTTEPMDGYYRIRPFYGASDQVADAELVNAFDEITSAHDFKGLSGAHIWARRPPAEDFTEIYPNGREGAYTPVFDGHSQIYDPRDDTTGFTRNAALILAYWLGELMGQPLFDGIADEADVCDQIVTDRDGETQPRWRIDGTISDDMDFEAQRAQLAAACDAFIFEGPDGKVGFRVGRYIEPTVTLTDADFLSLELTETRYGSDTPSAVAGIYISPDNAWREAPSGEYVIDNTIRRNVEQPELLMVSSHNQASRLNKRIGRMKHAKYRLSGSLNLVGYRVVGQRFVRVQLAALGIDEVFEVGELWRNANHTFDLSAVSVEEDDFAFDAAQEEPEPPEFGDVAPAPAEDEPSGLAATVISGVGIQYTWVPGEEVSGARLRIRKKGDTEWQFFKVDNGQTVFVFTAIEDGEIYEAQIQGTGFLSPLTGWAPEPPLEITALENTEPPDDLVDADVTAGIGEAVITWQGANDSNQHSVDIYRSTVLAFPGAGGLIERVVSGANMPVEYTDSGLAPDTYYYWIEPVNQSGIAGTREGAFTAVVT